jgi:hypothetical protein
MVRLVQTVHLSYVKAASSSRSTIGCIQNYLTIWYIWCKPYTSLVLTLTPSPNGLKQDSTWPTSPRSSIGWIQNHFWANGMLAQTAHLSCTDTNTISKWTKTIFDMSLVTQENNQVRPKQFYSQWYIWRNPCAYPTPTLTPSPNGLKQELIWPTSSRSSIEHVQINSEPIVCSVQTVHLSFIMISTISKLTDMSFDLSLVT